MSGKIKKAIQDLEREADAAVADVERVLVKFIGHVRHNGKDYQPGESASIEAASAKTLAQLSVVQPVVAAVPAPDVDTGSNNPPASGNDAGQAAAAAPAEPASAQADAAASAGA